MRSCYRFTITGRVQGVFFRASTRDKAQELGLQGWVRNTRTGQVELLACGEAGSMGALKNWLWQGPKFANVTDVESEFLSDVSVDDFQGFVVRPDG